MKWENSEQLSSTQWCKEGANGTLRGRDMAAVTATGWKSSTYIYKKKSTSYFDSLHVTIKRNFLASYFPYKHSPLDKVNGSPTAMQKGSIGSIDVTD